MNNPLDVKEYDEYSLEFAPHLFGLGEFSLSVYGSCFLPQRCSFARSITKLHQARYMTSNKRA
jgi:hypothetical protein